VQFAVSLPAFSDWPNAAPFARAARHDGVVPRKAGSERGEVFTTDDFLAMRAVVGRDGDGFAYVAIGSTESPTDTAMVREWEGAGANWWLESLYPFGGRAAAMRDRLRAGPPTR